MRTETPLRGLTRQWLRVALTFAVTLGAFDPKACVLAADSGASADEAWPHYQLTADRWWLLNEPQGRRLDASGLLKLPSGEFLTVNDQNAAVYRMVIPEGTNVIQLERWPEIMAPDQIAPFVAAKSLRYDLEGLARDDTGRIYLCEEADRWILRWDPARNVLERLEIDWSPVRRWFDSGDRNASFEGVAVGGNRLYVANERQVGRILVVDLGTLGVIDDFQVAPSGNTARDVHYTDLCWAEGSLWVLLRDVRKILKVEPATKRVRAEIDFDALERAPDVAYSLALLTPGFMEGLSVDEKWIWMVTDNNGMPRRANRGDTRPTLFRCPRPDLPRQGGGAGSTGK